MFFRVTLIADIDLTVIGSETDKATGNKIYRGRDAKERVRYFTTSNIIKWP